MPLPPKPHNVSSWRVLTQVGLTILSVFLVGILLMLFLPNDLNPFRSAAGLVLIFFIPGFSISLALWPWTSLGVISRLIISVAISLASVPLAMFISIKNGATVTAQNTLIQITLVVLGAVVLWILRQAISKKRQAAHSSKPLESPDEHLLD